MIMKRLSLVVLLALIALFCTVVSVHSALSVFEEEDFEEEEESMSDADMFEYLSAVMSMATATERCVTAASLNVRSGPSTANRIVASLFKGNKVSVQSSSNGWSLIGAGRWVSSEFLGSCGGGAAPVTRCVNTSALNVRSGPGTNHGIVGSLGMGAQVTVTSSSNGFSQIGAGRWVSADYLGACGGGNVGGGYDCGEAFVSGRSVGRKQCVKIDGKPVVTTTAAAFNSMKAAAAGAGVTLSINSGFRTMAEQQYFYNCYVTKKCNNGNLAAAPGHSNHQNGIALDISVPTNAYNWLKNNASRFGFVRTVASETWHWELRPGTRCNAIVNYACN